jgi:hypothetical protein
MSAKTVKLSLSLITAAFMQIDSRAQIHALGYDTPAYIDFEFSEISVYENQPAAVINIFRSGDVRETTRISFATEEGTATEGQDYKGTGGTITFQPGEGMKQVSIAIIADDETEPDETFKLLLTDPSPGTLVLRDHITITIKDVAGPIATPKLEIVSAGPRKISLSWEGDPGYALERTVNAASDAWETVNVTPVVSGTHCVVTEPAGGVLYLYRLRVN